MRYAILDHPCSLIVERLTPLYYPATYPYRDIAYQYTVTILTPIYMIHSTYPKFFVTHPHVMLITHTTILLTPTVIHLSPTAMQFPTDLKY